MRAVWWVVLLGGLARAQPAPPAAPFEGTREYNSTVHARPRRDDNASRLVLTARDLEQRGVQNLKDALDLIPEVQVRQGGMGTRIDVRGAKQSSILLMIDGVPIDEPYYGAFELSSIPITDIVEIRVTLAPASPLDGPGGDGGVIEVFTLHATGKRRIDARVVGGSTPEAEGAVTGRHPLNRSGSLGLRASVGGRWEQPEYPVTAADGAHGQFADQAWQSYGALRLEWAGERARVTGDLWYGHRSYFIPPSDTAGTLLQHITAQDAGRAVLGAEYTRGDLRIAVGGYGEVLSQASDYFTDYTLAKQSSHQDLISGRVGGAALVDRTWVRGELRARLSARLSVDGDGARVRQTSARATSGFATYGEAALGTRLDYRQLSLDAAVGALLPFADPGGAWPEAKLTLAVTPIRQVKLLLIGARKGRLPTIRELYDPVQGNAELRPEQTWHGEFQMQARPHRLVALRFSGYVRQIDGLIRLDPTQGGRGMMNARNTNLDTIDVRGFETGFDVARDQVLGAGLTYVFEDARSPTLGSDPIANFPRHKLDAYLASTVLHKRLGAILRLRWVTEREAQGVTLPRYYVMELYLWGRIWKALRGAVRIENLTNAHYLLLPGLAALGTTAVGTLEGTWE